MARTNIQVFNAGYQNIMDDDNYNVNVQRTRGVTAGIADPLLHNKLYRQTSIMAKALADYIVSQGQDCLDTDLNAITNAFTKALETHTRKNTGVLVTESKTAVNTADWNTLIESRTYKITGATFAADKHQPVGAIGTGELVVLKNGDDTIVQVYYANSTEFDKAGAYHRVNIGGTWTDWVYNITNKGGTVTGDFTINGKLTVDTIEVSELNIDGAPPLKQDAIDRLQAQIISPYKTIVVDNVDGSDETGDGTYKKPYKTLDFVTKNKIEKNKYTNLIINLVAKKDVAFETTALDCYLTGISSVTIQKGIGSVYKPKIKLNYGKVWSGAFAEGTRYNYGNILIGNVNSCTLLEIIIIIENDNYYGDRYCNFVVKTSYLYSYGVEFRLNKYNLLLLLKQLDQKLYLNVCNLTGSTGFIASSKNISTINDPSINLSENAYTANLPAQISGCIIMNSIIPNEVLSNGDEGFDTNIKITYKN